LQEVGVRIRARWVSTPTRRQDVGLGPAFDGSQGVDSQDILGIPQIGFSTFQLFPDQNEYEPDDPNLSASNNSIAAGLEWISQQAKSAQLYGTFKSFENLQRSLIHPVLIGMANQPFSPVSVL
jgi:mannan endo-1,4-beta-mannosidase